MWMKLCVDESSIAYTILVTLYMDVNIYEVMASCKNNVVAQD